MNSKIPVTYFFSHASFDTREQNFFFVGTNMSPSNPEARKMQKIMSETVLVMTGHHFGSLTTDQTEKIAAVHKIHQGKQNTCHNEN